MEKIRLAYIDRLKGLCILAVIIGHFAIWPLGLDDDWVTLFVTSFHMPVFMFLSGLVLSTPDLSKCIRKLPHFILPMLFVGLSLTLYNGNSPKDFILSSTKSGYWYLWVLSIFYILLSIFNSFYPQKSIKVSYLISLVDLVFGITVFGVLLVLKMFATEVISQFLSIDQCFALWPCFYIGYMAKKYSMTDYIVKHQGVATIGVLSYIILFVFYVTGIRHLYMIVAITSIVPFIYLFKKRNNSKTRIEQELSRIGRKSLDIYIYHYFIVDSISLISVGKWIRLTNNIFLEGVIALFFAIPIAYLCIIIAKIIKNFPLLYRIVYGKSI
uniref:Acyltransferase n=1 Tax=Prevotella sp. GTC17262 TaxID=3236797 RepID=A0AB33JFM0_9BACT